MKDRCTIASSFWMARHWLTLLFLPFMLIGCGGGGSNLAGGGIVGTGNAPIVAVGTITAFGAGTVTVTAQQFSVSNAAITVNDQPATAAALRIGMVVTVQADTQSDGTKLARSVTYRAEAKGVVDGVDTTAAAFTVLGQRVPVNKLTVFDGGSFDTLVSQYVEVSGYRASPGEVVATRVEIKPSFVTGVTPLQVTGIVAALDTTNRVLQVGAQVVDYSQIPATQIPAGLANGATVQANGTTFSTSGALRAQSLIVIVSTLQAPAGAAAEIEGYVSDFASVASFNVNGQSVNATSATAVGGSLDMIANNVKLEVEGRLLNGVVVASKIEFEDVPALTLDGLVDSVDSAASKLGVAGQSVTVAASTQFQDSSAAAVRNFGLWSISVGDRVTVRAVHAGNGLLAQRVERRDRTAPPPADPTAEVEGPITAFTSVANFIVGARSVNAGSATFTGGSGANLAVGVRVHAEGTLSGDVILARSVEILAPDPASSNDFEVRGTIDAFASIASFRVAGQAIDASGAQFSGGTAVDLANGRFVEVSGTLIAGVVHARSVTFENVAPTTPTIEAEGPISQFVSIASFTVAGQAVDASNATFTHGRSSDLANGRIAHAVGPLVSGVLRATSISIEDPTADAQIELEGRVSNFMSVSRFTVAGRAVDATAARFSHGTASNLANGKQVHVLGTLSNGIVRATSVDFGD